MKPARIILLAVAIIAGGLAAIMAMQDDRPKVEEPKTIIQEEAKVRVLVARRGIGVGERLTPEVLRWQEWPAKIVRPEFITEDMAPDAMDELDDAVARFVFFEGEPIREAKLARSSQGYLSAVIEPGKRAVSIKISAESGAGGFIVPNDRVDVVLTSKTEIGERSETILQNVKVLVIDSRFDYAGSQDGDVREEDMAFSNETIAVLELDPEQSETIVNASEIGELALVLRSVADFGEQASDYKFQGANAEIRVIKFGKEVNIVSGRGMESSLVLREEEVEKNVPVTTQEDIYFIPEEYGDLKPGDEFISSALEQ